VASSFGPRWLEQWRLISRYGFELPAQVDEDEPDVLTTALDRRAGVSDALPKVSP
jgi:hypothetical protein